MILTLRLISSRALFRVQLLKAPRFINSSRSSYPIALECQSNSLSVPGQEESKRTRLCHWGNFRIHQLFEQDNNKTSFPRSLINNWKMKRKIRPRSSIHVAIIISFPVSYRTNEPRLGNDVIPIWESFRGKRTGACTGEKEREKERERERERWKKRQESEKRNRRERSR